MADGPRALRANEWPRLDALVSTVFRSGMLTSYPQLFNEANRDNLRVIADGGTVVCHVGMMRRPASLLGCRVDVACIGAVATFAEHRGQGFASAAFQDCCHTAAAAGGDRMLISGGRGLYTRVGCRRVGRDWSIVVDAADAEIAARLRTPAIAWRLRAIAEDDVPKLASLYATEAVRFLRPLEDWSRAWASRIVMASRADFWGIFLPDRLIAYILVHPPRPQRQPADIPSVRVVEYAGDRAAIAGALPLLAHRYQAQRVDVHVQGWDVAMHARLTGAGCPATPSPARGTLRVLNFPQFMERCRPLLAERLGAAPATALQFSADEPPGSADGRFTIRHGAQRLPIPDLGTLATFLFADPPSLPTETHDVVDLSAHLAAALPLPALWYGISDV